MLMRLLRPTLLMLLVSGCGNDPPPPVEPPVENPICIGSRAARAEHAAALADTQDERVLMTGAALIDILDAGCAA